MIINCYYNLALFCLCKRYFMKRNFWLSVCIATSIALSCATVYAANSDYVITLDNNVFSPAELTVPAGQKIKLTIKNLGSGTAEFESSDLGREKVIGAKSEITVLVGPLDAGEYTYFNDFHRESTGKIKAQ